VTCKTDVTHLARLLGGYNCLERTTVGEETIGIVEANIFVVLDQIYVVGLEPS